MNDFWQFLSSSAYPLSRSGFPEEESIFQWVHRKTYMCLRFVMAIVAFILPVVFLISAKWVDMQGSISAFYHTDMRNVFVGLVFAIGMCLYAYKGYNNLENYCLTAAGLFLFGVALAPTAVPQDCVNSIHCDNWDLPIVHNVCAVVFFSLIAVVCIFARSHPLKKSGNGDKSYDVSFSTAYNIIATLMTIVLVVAAILFILDRFRDITFPSSTFYVEFAAIWVFALYWCVKSCELNSLERALWQS